MSYMDLENLIKDEGYRNIKCIWYCNPKFCFSRGLRPINCDNDVLKFYKDIKGFELVDVYVEHSIEVTHVVKDDVDGCPNYGDDEADSDVEVISNLIEVEAEVEKDNVKAEVEKNHVEAEVEKDHEPIGMDDSDDDDDEDYIVSESEISSYSHELNECDVDYDSDMLHTPNESDNDEEQEKFPSFKSDSSKFELGMVFSNKEKIHEVVANYDLKMNKNVISRKMMDRRWQAKTTYLAKQFGHILRHNPDMKPAGLIAQAIDRWGVNLSRDQAYRFKRKAIDLLQGASMDQFNHLRSYAQELLKSNPNSSFVIRCSPSNEGHVFERIYVSLEACKYGFAMYFRPLIGLDSFFLKDLEAINKRAYAFISYQQKGLVPAIQTVSARVEQRLCAKHLYGNWKKKSPDLEFKEVNNMCETFNREILEYRDKPIITLLEGTKHYLTKRLTKKKE
ncbi:uncharacterized protein LOC131659733 [Vicia villosa]|uniref:uncharacterized protein LOC131659733 n=1 Tax=Vicia villosa TaxID=3911 RepID=UPI00273C812E|nr:uncharacterized protein LOC131659733 [Vicia villosa]